MDVTMEAPDELFEYEAELVDERLEEEENQMDEQFLKNQEQQMLRDGDGEKRNIVDPEEILEQVEDIYAGFEEKKGWLFTNESNVGNLEAPSFIQATGGTITTRVGFRRTERCTISRSE